jgi:hypothetical protein
MRLSTRWPTPLTPGFVLLACCACLLVVGAGIRWAVQDWAPLHQLQEAQARGYQLDAQRQTLLWRFEARRQIVNDLVCGRLSLREALDALRAMPEPPARRTDWGTGSEDERLLLEILAHLPDLFPDQPEKVARVERRLRREFPPGAAPKANGRLRDLAPRRAAD